MMRPLWIVIPAVVLLALAPGSGTPAFGAAAKAAEPKGAAAVPVAGGTGQKAAPAGSDYRYSAAGKSDPFRPFMEIDPVVVKQREAAALKRQAATARRAISPLQQLDVEMFRLVGILGTESERRAVVVDGAAKKFYPLTVGTPIGLNGGRVTAIAADRVVVTEPVVEAGGKRQKQRQVTLKLYKDE